MFSWAEEDPLVNTALDCLPYLTLSVFRPGAASDLIFYLHSPVQELAESTTSMLGGWVGEWTHEQVDG